MQCVFLARPLTKEIRYVGVSLTPYRRYFEKHLNPQSASHKDNWIRSLSCQPLLEIVCWTSPEFARELEVRLIAKLPNLTNSTAGGDGLCGATDDVRKRMSESCRAGWEKRKGIPTKKKGKPWSEKRRQMEAAKPRVIWTPERIAKHNAKLEKQLSEMLSS